MPLQRRRRRKGAAAPSVSAAPCQCRCPVPYRSSICPCRPCGGAGCAFPIRPCSCPSVLHLHFALMPSWLALAHRALSGAPRLAVFVEDHSGSGVEIDLGRLSEAGHHHVESDGEDRFHDFLRTEILAHRGEGRVGHSDILDHLPPERQQRAFGVIEGLVLVVAAFNAINLLLLHTDAESNRNMLAPAFAFAFTRLR